MERNNTIFYQDVFYIYIYIGAYLHYMHLSCPVYAIYGTAASVTLSRPILFTSVTQLAIWCLLLHRRFQSTKKELMQLQWFPHHNRNVEKRKNQCYRVSRIERENNISIRLLGEPYQQHDVASTPQNSHNNLS